MKKVLIIDDDPTFLMMLKSFLSKKNFSTRSGISAHDALQILKKESFDIILLDFKLPDKNGIDLLKELKPLKKDTPIILMTSYADIKTAVKAIKLGAYDYVSKPVNNDDLYSTIQQALELKASKEESGTEAKPLNFNYIDGVSKAAAQIRNYIDLVAPTNFSVIIQGESGTGKEFVARMIHAKSERKNKPFIAIDCGALSKDLAGSELFGHVKGSFTGAITDKEGQFQSANQGTIFLDEIGNLSYEIQVKLLRAIQERKIRKIGSNQDLDIDVRIIVATNEDLSQAVEMGEFREDLYHRLNEFSINVPPLREREADTLLFAEHFLSAANTELRKNIKGFSKEAREVIEKYHWPGNIRELKNLVKRAVLLAHEDTISTECLPQEITKSTDKEYEAQYVSKGDTSDLKAVAEKNEREIILKTLEKVGYNKSKAARMMNIDRKTLYNKLKLYGLES